MIKPKASTPISVQDENRAAEILGRVRRMEVRTNRLVDDSLAGRYASVFKGRGMDFDRVRNYVPGDDVRTIDWNVTARTGEAHVKLFTEERELTILLMIDVSASSDFGSVVDSKRELAAEAAGVLAASAIRNHLCGRRRNWAWSTRCDRRVGRRDSPGSSPSNPAPNTA